MYKFFKVCKFHGCQSLSIITILFSRIFRPSKIHRFCEHSLPSVTKHVAHMTSPLIASWRHVSLSKLSPGNITIHYWIIQNRLKSVAVSLNLSFNEVASLVTTDFQGQLIKLKHIHHPLQVSNMTANFYKNFAI